MKTLNEKEWCAIPVVEIFSNFIGGKGKGLVHLRQIEHGISYIGATNRNNGVLCFVEKDKYSKNMIQKGNCIGFIKNGDGSAGYAVYKKEPFISTSDVIYGYADWLNLNSGIFFVATQDKIKPKYSHGYKRNQQHLKGDRVMLPIDDGGKPDFEYMEQFVSNKRKEMVSHYKTFVLKQLEELEYLDIPTLGEKEWRKFKVFGEEGFMDIATTKSSIDAINLKDGEAKFIPYITRTNNNNGVARFVSEENLSYGVDKAGSITVGLDTQTAFWQPRDFVTGQNIQILTSNRLNVYLAQFLIPLLRNQMVAKFNWGGNGATLGRMNRLEMMLPINNDGKPDYEYMEQYTKNMMLKKYNQYLDFIERQEYEDTENV